MRKLYVFTRDGDMVWGSPFSMFYRSFFIFDLSLNSRMPVLFDYCSSYIFVDTFKKMRLLLVTEWIANLQRIFTVFNCESMF